MKNLSDVVIPASLSRVISTPHEHEGEDNPPLWIVWKHFAASDGIADLPSIDCICNSEDMACYAVRSLLYERHDDLTVYVERVPANHRFASSMSDVFEDRTLSRIRAARANRLRG